MDAGAKALEVVEAKDVVMRMVEDFSLLSESDSDEEATGRAPEVKISSKYKKKYSYCLFLGSKARVPFYSAPCPCDL